MWVLKDTISKLAVNLCYLSRKKLLSVIRDRSSLLISIGHFLMAFSKIDFFVIIEIPNNPKTGTEEKVHIISAGKKMQEDKNKQGEMA